MPETNQPKAKNRLEELEQKIQDGKGLNRRERSEYNALKYKQK